MIVFETVAKHPLGYEGINKFRLSFCKIGELYEIKEEFRKNLTGIWADDIIKVFDFIELTDKDFVEEIIKDEPFECIWNNIISHKDELRVLCTKYYGIMICYSKLE